MNLRATILTIFAVTAGGYAYLHLPRPQFWVAVVLVVLVLFALWRRSEKHPWIEAVQNVFRSKSATTATRWGEQARRKRGMASTFDIVRRGSWIAMRRTARTVRPSRRQWSLYRRLVHGHVRDVGVELCRVGFQRVWASVEDVVLVFGGPRTGKTGWMGARIIDAPGAVLVTSTRTDLYDITAEHRRGRGPVYVFNAAGLAGIPSSIRFDPLMGCTDPVTPAQRATDMLPTATGSGDAEMWTAQARRVLAGFLHAAALGGLSMTDVLRWTAAPKDAEAEITRLLRRSPAPAYEQDIAQFLHTNDKTQTSITASLMPALQWLNSPAACAAAHAGDGAAFDVAQLLREHATVYLLGKEEDHVAPLLAALTGHIAREARRVAAACPGGRLDPPLSCALDEAALSCPVPLEQWTADMGGAGVALWCAFQSRAQLIRKWGDAGAAIVLNNAGAVLLFGGTKDPKDLDAWANLFGKRDEMVETRDEKGKVKSRTVRQTAVIQPSQLSTLPPRHVALLRRGMPPAIGRARMVWHRWDVRVAPHAKRAAGVVTFLAGRDAAAYGWCASRMRDVVTLVRAHDAHPVTRDVTRDRVVEREPVRTGA
jgi:type IV secretion system protein VirD4